MFTFCYDFLLSLAGIFNLPKWLVRKKYRLGLLNRLGFKLPQNASQKKPVFWIHMVSMGETRAMIPLYEILRRKYPNAGFYFSSTTATGYKEAKRSLKGAEDYFFLPLDLSWIMKPLVKKLRPDILILSESDFWYNLIKSVKNRGSKVFLLNGKISEKSVQRFSKLPFFANKLFREIDLFCLQNEEYAKRFTSLSIPKEKISITGNLKLGIPSQELSEEEKEKWKTHFGLPSKGLVLTIGSTHENEEKLILKQVTKIPYLTILLVPRHPERFPAVKKLLLTMANKEIILVEEMGVLPICYQLCDLAIVGGSFISGIGGHNIFEPIQAKIPVLFGPYMDNQKELEEMVLDARAGFRVPPEDISYCLGKALKSLDLLTQNAQRLSRQGQEIPQKTFEAIESTLRNSLD